MRPLLRGTGASTGSVAGSDLELLQANVSEVKVLDLHLAEFREMPRDIHAQQLR